MVLAWFSWPICPSAHDEVGDLLRLVDLHVVPGAAEQVQLAVGE